MGGIDKLHIVIALPTRSVSSSAISILFTDIHATANATAVDPILVLKISGMDVWLYFKPDVFHSTVFTRTSSSIETHQVEEKCIMTQ